MTYTHKYLLASSLLILAILPSTSRADLLLNHWTFEESDTYITAGGAWAKDIVGGADGMLMGDANVGDGTLKMDGYGDYMKVSGLEFRDSFAIEAMVRVAPTAFNIMAIIGNTRATADMDGLKIFINRYNTADGAIAFESGDDRQYMGKQVFSPAGTFQCSETAFQHIRVEIDRRHPAGQQVRMYYNSNLVATGPAVAFAVDNDYTTIGSMYGAWCLDGEIADLRIMQIPEPATIGIIGLGSVVLAFRKRSAVAVDEQQRLSDNAS